MTARRPLGRLSAAGRSVWTVPALLVVYGAVCLALAPFAVSMVVDGVAAQHAIASGRTCTTPSDTRCVQQVEGTLSGPYRIRRSLDHRWELWDGGQEIDDFDVGPRGSWRLSARQNEDVTGLVYDGEVMQVRAADGTVVTTTDDGWDGTVRGLFVLWLALTAATRLPLYAFRKRRLVGGWWRQGRGPELGDWDVTLAVTPTAGFAAMAFGAPWWLALVASLLALLMWVSVLDTRLNKATDRLLDRVGRLLPRWRSGGRHAADPEVSPRSTEPS